MQALTLQTCPFQLDTLFQVLGTTWKGKLVSALAIVNNTSHSHCLQSLWPWIMSNNTNNTWFLISYIEDENASNLVHIHFVQSLISTFASPCYINILAKKVYVQYILYTPAGKGIQQKSKNTHSLHLKCDTLQSFC